MLMGRAAGALPSSVMVPVTEPAVAASTVFAEAGAVAAGCEVDSFFVELPPQPAITTAAATASTNCINLLFICCPSSLSKRIILAIPVCVRQRFFTLAALLAPSTRAAGSSRQQPWRTRTARSQKARRTSASCTRSARRFCPARSRPRRRAANQRRLLLWSQREHVAHQQIGVIAVVLLQTGRQRPGEYPVVAIPVEQARRHRRTGDNFRGIGDPALGPRGLQAVMREQEVRRRRHFIVHHIARHVALQTRRRRARE